MTGASNRVEGLPIGLDLSGWCTEMTGTFVCATSLSIVPTVRHADYLGA